MTQILVLSMHFAYINNIYMLKPGYLLRFMGAYIAILPPAGQSCFTSSDLVLTNIHLYNI